MNKTILLLTPQRNGSHYIKSLLQTSKNVVVTGIKQADHVIAQYIGLSRLPTHEDHQVFTLSRNLNIIRNEKFFELNKAQQELKKWFESENNYQSDKNIFLLHMPTAISYFDILLQGIKCDHMIYSVRNPYAVVASILKVRPNVDLEEATLHAGNLLVIYRNLNHNNLIKFTYEEMCSNPQRIQDLFISNIPELSIDINKPVSTLSPCTTENNKELKNVQNFNQKTISTLNESSINKITKILSRVFYNEMEKLGYDLL